MAFPEGFGLWGSCKFCPARDKCDQGRHCKIFTNLKTAGSHKKPKIVLQTNRNTYAPVDLMLLAALWTIRLLTLFCVCYFIYDRIGGSLCVKM